MSQPRPYRPGDYRFPFEHAILTLTVVLVLGVIALTATATVCASGLFVIAMLVLGYLSTRAHHQALLQQAELVTPQTAPAMAELVDAGRGWLQVEPVAVYVLPSPELNAYTFGLTTPKVVVINAGLLRLLTADELAFVICHELGHVRLGHTWLNSLVGGLSGIPSPYAALALMHLAFRWWNRACEHSADRAGLLATGRPEAALSALIKLGGGHLGSASPRAAGAWPSEDEVLAGLGEALATHPNIARRVAELQRWAASPQFQRLMERRAHAHSAH